MNALFVDFLVQIQWIELIIVPNDRLPRCLHLGMWFACFGGVCKDPWPFPLGAILGHSGGV